jgi:hypothetical protein
MSSMPRLRAICLILLGLLPGAWFAWQWREMPSAGAYHDDGLYYVGAQSLAQTGEYRILSLPGEPYQTKYPPFWPLLLSLAWHLEPRYPDNLQWAMVLAWMWLPLTAFAYRAWLRQAGAGETARWLLPALWAANPYGILFSTSLLSELPFTGLLLAALLLLGRADARWTAVAGAAAGLAFLTRSAGIAVLPAVVGWLLLRREFRRAGIFAAVFCPIAAGWFWWAAAHRARGTDEISLYYTNYFGYHMLVFVWREFSLYLWRNLDGLVNGLGALLLPTTTNSMLEKVLALSLGVAGISGVVRRVRREPRGLTAAYAYFCLGYSLLLVVWHFPPNERFVLPMGPLWLLGIATEFLHVGGVIRAAFRNPDRGQRVAGGVLVGVMAVVAGWCGWRQVDLLAWGIPAAMRDHDRRFRETAAAMEYLRERLPAEASVLSGTDPAVYLRSGRRGAGHFVPTIHWYRTDQKALEREYSDAPGYCKRLGIGYILLHDWEYARDLPPETHAAIHRQLRADARLELVFSSGPAALYRVR